MPPENKVEIMGILNLTPDSFSDGGKFFALEDAARHAAEMISAGADIIDLGAESTRPGHLQVVAEEELARLIPALCEIRKTFPKAKISVDTYKGEVADAAMKNGADIINDVWGGMRKKFFKESGISTAEVSAKFGCPIILMHNRPQETLPMRDMQSEIFSDFEKILENAFACGVDSKNIILDGGFGFAKTHGQNLELVKNYGKLRKFGYPLLLGLSRKSTLRLHFGTGGADDATLAFDMWAVCNKVCDMIRVHDVARHRLFANSQTLIENTGLWTK